MTGYFHRVRSVFRNHVSLDRVGVAVTFAGCAALAVDADQQGRAVLKGERPASSYDSPKTLFTDSQCRQLESEGYLVIDNFLSPRQVRQACEAIESLDAKDKFLGSPVERDNPVVYQKNSNRVLQYKETDGQCNLVKVRHMISGFARGIVDSDFQGFAFGKGHDSYTKDSLYVPNQMQVSICGGEGLKPTHDFYSSHLDTAGADRFFELGLLGWLRSQFLRRRYLTCIVYLNEQWQDGDGGCLRVFKKGGDLRQLDKAEYVDVAPLAGRMIVFSSRTQFHGVLPAQVQRYACAVWLTLKDT